MSEVSPLSFLASKSIRGHLLRGAVAAALLTFAVKVGEEDKLYGSVNNGGTWTDITNKVVSGTAISWDGATLSGSSNIVFYIADAAGNVGAPTGSTAYQLDTTDPVAGTLSFDLLEDTGSTDSPPITTDNNFNLVLTDASGGTSVLWRKLDSGSWEITTANQVNLQQTPAVLGALLTLDPAAERCTGDGHKLPDQALLVGVCEWQVRPVCAEMIGAVVG